MYNTIFTAILAVISCISAIPLSSDHAGSSIIVSQIYQFPSPDHWFENLVVRPNGKIVATELTGAKLWQIDPFKTCSLTSTICNSQDNTELIYEFPEYLGLLGLVGYREDAFAFIAGDFSIAEGFKSYPGTYTIWSADFNHDTVQIEKIAYVPSAEFLNGMAYLESDDSFLLADSGLGFVWKLDLKTEQSEVAISDLLMKKVDADAPDGINGLKIYGDELWFTRGFDAILANMQITSNGSAAKSAAVVGTGLNSTWTMDDFVVSSAGQAYAAIPFQNLVARYDGGPPAVIAGNINSTEIAEPTSLAFGQTRHGQIDESILYVATGGAIADPINGNVTVGGQIVKIQLGHSR